MRPPARLQHRLDALADTPVNFDADALDLADPPAGWAVDDRSCALPAGSFDVAARLIRGYEFADPSLVRAFYDPDAPLEGRDMLLALRALGLITVHVGVRVCVVWDETRTVDGRRARVWGWAYRTLQGHVEQGQMGWQVWEWQDSGEVEFRLRAVSRTARITNPVIAIGFRLVKGHERGLYLQSTLRRMQELTAAALSGDSPGDAVRSASPGLTARREAADDDADDTHEELAKSLEEPGGEGSTD